MKRKRLLAGGVLTLAIIVASTSVSWSRPVVPDGANVPDPGNVFGVAGPAGPEQFSPIATYFKRATYRGNERRQFHMISAPLPAGRYLVEVLTPGSTDAVDCMGVTFALVPSHDKLIAYTGYVTVIDPATEVTVSCVGDPHSQDPVATYELYFIPVPG